MKSLEKLEKYEIKNLMHKFCGAINTTYCKKSGPRGTCSQTGGDSFDMTPTHNTNTQAGLDSAANSGKYTEDNWQYYGFNYIDPSTNLLQFESSNIAQFLEPADESVVMYIPMD
jgi:hypothetical protein